MFRGFDTYGFPGTTNMDWLAANTNLKWTGLYLSHAPGKPDLGWINAYSKIAKTWGIAPIYVGRQAPAAGELDDRSTKAASIDAEETIQLAREAAIPLGKVIYLDIETGGLQPENAMAYITGWIDATRHGGYTAGVYCSYLTLNQLLAARPGIVAWVWRLTIDSHTILGPDFDTDEGAPAAPYTGARMQQYAQNCSVDLMAGQSLQIDASVSTVADPSIAPSN